MKKKIYVLFPIVIFAIILLNAFFGHLIFASQYDKTINKYSIYIHLNEDWKSYPGNILFDITNVWNDPRSQKSLHEAYYDPEIPIEDFKDQNFNTLDYQRGKSFVELKHEYSDCNESWNPISYRYALDTIRNRIEFFQGKELKGDPYASVYPKISNQKYDDNEQERMQKSGYVQFIPVCTDKDFSTFEYSLKINSQQVGFDVYFVPSKNEIANFLEESDSFNYYKHDGCFGKNFQSYHGVCENVSNQGGLLIVIPDDLNLALTKVTVHFNEI